MDQTKRTHSIAYTSHYTQRQSENATGGQDRIVPAWTCLCVVTFWEGLGGGRCAGWVSRQGGRWRGKRRGRRERGRGTYEGNEMPRFHGRWSVGACGPPAKASDLMEERKEGRKEEGKRSSTPRRHHALHALQWHATSQLLCPFSSLAFVFYMHNRHSLVRLAWSKASGLDAPLLPLAPSP